MVSPFYSFLIESSSKLLVTRTGIKAWSSLILGWIRPLIWSYLPLSDENSTLLNLNISEARWPNFMCSITGVGERLHKVLGQIGSKLWFPWQQKAPIDLKWGKWCLHLSSVVFDLTLLKRPHLTMVHWTQVSDQCPLGYLFPFPIIWQWKLYVAIAMKAHVRQQ